ncbi:MAG: PAS domain S-box protein [Xanthobacteraceae bacterium]|nr:PAS domain S-box protein [Xanthobacteraceae bacterium]
MKIAALLAAFRAKRRSLRLWLVALVAAALVPALLFGGWLTFSSAQSERALLERNADNKAKEVMADIDHEIATATAMLTALASSHFLQTGDYAGFHGQATEVSRQLNVQIVLRDATSGQQIVNASVNWGETLPQAIAAESLSAMQEALKTGKPTISNVFYGAFINRYFITAGIPVSRGGHIAYYLLVAIPADTFSDALKNAGLPGQWIVALIDRGNNIIARSERHSEYAGTKVNFNFAKKVTKTEGVNIGPTRYGDDFRWSWRRSASTGWVVAVGMPTNLLRAPQNTALLNYAAASGVVLLVSLALTYYLSGLLPHSIGALGIDRTPTKEEFRILFESAPNGVLVVDEKRRIVLANERLDQKFGYERSELIGKPASILFPDRFWDASAPAGSTAIVSLKSPQSAGDRYLSCRRKDGGEFPVEILINPIATEAGRFVIVTIIDVTPRVQAAERLAAAVSERDELRRRLMQAQEEERVRLARELHDQTGQTLTAAMLELKGLEIQFTEAGRSHIRTLRERMEEIGKSLHRIARELRPASIDELGLNSALANYVAEWSQQFGIAADFHRGDVDLDALTDEKRTAIYRIVQEALTNIAKHAREATSVSVLVGRSGSTLQLTIEDNGRGFDAAVPSGNSGLSGRRGLGLAGMRERLALIGGELEIESSSGVGTTVFARIPLDLARLSA